MTLFCLQVLGGNVSQADWDRLQYYSRKVKSFAAMSDEAADDFEVHPSTYLRIAQLQSSSLLPSLRHLRCTLCDMSIFLFQSPLLESLELHNISGNENTIVGPFLTTLSSQMLNRIVLNSGRLSADIFKKSIVHFKHLRSLELIDAVFMSDFTLLEVLGTLPSLENLTLEANDPVSHPAQAPDSISQSGGRKYFDALASLCVTGTFFLIQHLLRFIDSPCLESINICAVFNHDREPEDLFTPSMTIVASKWSQSLKNLSIDIDLGDIEYGYAISKGLMLLTDLHEMQTFNLIGWRMENMDDDVRRLVMSWPKLRTLNLRLNQTSISLSTLRIIAENCPKLRFLRIPLDISTIPPFDTSIKSLRHNLEVLIVLNIHPSAQTTLECQIQVTRYLYLIFPYLKFIRVDPNNITWSGICDLFKLCQDTRLD